MNFEYGTPLAVDLTFRILGVDPISRTSSILRNCEYENNHRKGVL